MTDEEFDADTLSDFYGELKGWRIMSGSSTLACLAGSALHAIAFFRWT